MEEIYKPNDPERIEVYHTENNDMLGDMPGWLIYTGSYTVYGLIVLLVIGSALFQYPDVVKQHIRIDDTGSVEWITSNHTGMIDRFLVEDGTPVRAGDTLGIFKNTASLEDVKTFCQVLTKVEYYYRTLNADYLQNYPFDLIMGDMTPAYEQFTQAVRNCLMYHEFDLYPQKKKFLDEELKILHASGKADELSLLNIKRELFDLKIAHQMEVAKNLRTLELAYENMVNQLKTWDNTYLIKCRNSGTVLWGKSWSLDERIAEGDTLCTVLSEKRGTPTGHVLVDEAQIANIAVGDKVNIELNKYPSQSYGKLTGQVASVSFIPHNKSYAIEIAFPNELSTTNGKKINYEVGLSGQAEIITLSQSILSRIFAPIKEVFK